MSSKLRLTLTDYIDSSNWRWVLEDGDKRFLADHDVRLDAASREYRGFLNLSDFLDYHQPIHPPDAQLAELGCWIGEHVFGGLRQALRENAALPARAVHVIVPAEAQDLLFRPFELARFDDQDQTPFWQAGVRFVYQLDGAAGQRPPARQAQEPNVRLLAAFSLPGSANPLNLRRERYQLQRLVRQLNRTHGVAVELRVLQYGATRQTLQAALEEAEGWDVIHLSGHGHRGELLLEDDRGGIDTINAEELGELLERARERLKLLVLDTCYSGAASHAQARAQVGLDKMPERKLTFGTQAAAETEVTPLPSLAQSLSQRLQCAALAMRYPVGDAFAIELTLSLYEKLLVRHQPLPAALHMALDHALSADIPRPPLSAATPLLLGPRAADLRLVPPQRPPGQFALPAVGLGIAFPPEPPRFVGRLQPMLRASQALAPRSERRGVLFYGIPGAGKTACALELSYRHAENRFQGYVWYRAPESDSDIASELFNLMFEFERQLNAPDLGLTTALDDPERFRRFTLPRLRALLDQNSLLVVLDNMETLLTESGGWRDRLWGDVLAALLDHNGASRVVLTSRRRPAGLTKHPRLLVEAIHALSFAESVLLAREMPHLKRLFDDGDGRESLRQTLRVVQGHPKLLELADSLSADRAALTARVAAAEDELAERGELLDAFFATGGEREGETRQEDADFVRALQGWTTGATSQLSPTAGLLFQFLCRLEPEDRQLDVVQQVWPHFLERLTKPADEPNSEIQARSASEGAAPAVRVAAKALTEPNQSLPTALASLESAALVAVDRPEIDSAAATSFTVHPGVAETVRAAADPAVLAAADIELGNYHIARYQHGLKTEMQGGGRLVGASGRRSAPYLLRQSRWQEASTLLERLLQRDRSPTALAFALPLLQRIAEATKGTERGLIDAGVLASALAAAGRTGEAEAMLRDVIARVVAQGNFRIASVMAGKLVDLVLRRGRLSEALSVAEEMAGYTRQAGLGPWSQLADETQRLQVLNAMGRYDEVLAAVESLRPQLDSLPDKSEADETADPWNARETLLDTGRKTAKDSKQYEAALELNADIVRAKQSRGVYALGLARTRYNDYGPLLRLHRYDEARNLLVACRAVFEAQRDLAYVGMVYSALADLEDKTGGKVEAIRFEQIALRYEYQAGNPEGCAISHHNLANYLERQAANPATVLAHRLAAAAIFLQAGAGHIRAVTSILASSELPPAPPAFADVVAEVGAIEGVRFAALLEQLPRTTPDGDAALAAIWQLVAEEKRRSEGETERQG